jgi:hypothetical protein
VTEHTCINTQTTYDGSVPPPCKACIGEPLAGGVATLAMTNPIRPACNHHADLAHVFSKWAGVEHSGTALDGTTIARQILHDFRAALNPILPPASPVPRDLADTDPSELAPASGKEATL